MCGRKNQNATQEDEKERRNDNLVTTPLCKRTEETPPTNEGCVISGSQLAVVLPSGAHVAKIRDLFGSQHGGRGGQGVPAIQSVETRDAALRTYNTG